MSILAQAWLPEAKDDLADAKSTLLKLRDTRDAVIAVRDYWTSVEEYAGKYETEWHAMLSGNDRLDFRGPGGLWVHFESGSIVINASCRWTGFCTIAELQRVHADAFVSIARALGESRLLLFPESGVIEDYLYDGLTFEEYAAMLRKTWGDCRTKFGIVTESIDELYAKPSPAWFLITI